MGSRTSLVAQDRREVATNTQNTGNHERRNGNSHDPKNRRAPDIAAIVGLRFIAHVAGFALRCRAVVTVNTGLVRTERLPLEGGFRGPVTRSSAAVDKETVKAMVQLQASVKDTEVLRWLILKGLEEMSPEDYERFHKKRSE